MNHKANSRHYYVLMISMVVLMSMEMVFMLMEKDVVTLVIVVINGSNL